MIKKALNKITITIGKKIAQLGMVSPFVHLYASKIEEIKPQAEDNGSRKVTILALNPNRFRGDLQILADSGQFRVLIVPFEWQTKILNIFWTKELKRKRKKDPHKYYRPGDDKIFVEVQTDFRRFLRKFLSSLYSRLKIDCVIGAGVHYIQDFDWGLVSNELGVPYIVLHRENLATGPGHVKFVHDFHRGMGQFKGSHIIVHNEIMKESLIESGFVNSDQVSALGCLRMDDYVRMIKDKSRHKSNHGRKQVVFFSFNHAVGLLGILNGFSDERNVGWVNLFEKTHVAMAELAIEHPDVDFIIKPKWGGNWLEEIQYAFKKYGIESNKISNLKILVDVDVHQLIFESDVVAGYGSTTVLEAAIAAKPVIMPSFDEALDPQYRPYVHFPNETHLFDIAHSPEEFKTLILKRLEEPNITEAGQAERYAVFEKYVSSMNADALDKYVKAIKNVVRKAQEAKKVGQRVPA